MPTLDACGSGVDCHHVILGVAHDFQDMGMPADEHLRPETVDQGSGSKVIMPGISSYVHHQYGHPSALEELVVRIIHADVLTVAVPIYSDQRFEGCYLFCSGEAAAEVSGMPDLVHGLEELLELWAEYSVSV